MQFCLWAFTIFLDRKISPSSSRCLYHVVLFCAIINCPSVFLPQYIPVLSGKSGFHPSLYPSQPSILCIIAFIEHLLCARPSLFSQYNEVETIILILWMNKLRLGRGYVNSPRSFSGRRQMRSVSDSESSDWLGTFKISFCCCSLRRKYGSRVWAFNLNYKYLLKLRGKKTVLSRKKYMHVVFYFILFWKTKQCFVHSFKFFLRKQRRYEVSLGQFASH